MIEGVGFSQGRGRGSVRGGVRDQSGKQETGGGLTNELQLVHLSWGRNARLACDNSRMKSVSGSYYSIQVLGVHQESGLESSSQHSFSSY